jgi:hypothetical protein
MPELEEQLRLLGAAIDFPPTPSLTRMVTERLAADAARPRSRPPLRRIALAFAAVVVAIAAALIVSPQARTTVLGWLGLKGVLVQPVKNLPSPTPTSGSMAERLQLGAPTSLSAATSGVTFHVFIPQSLGNPDQVFLKDAPPLGGEVSLTYAPRTGLPPTKETSLGLLLMEFRGDINPGFFGKLTGAGTTVQVVDVNGSPGYWISGEPHVFYYNDRTGQPTDEQLRLAGNTLLWEVGGVTLRIESALTKDQALAIARTVR